VEALRHRRFALPPAETTDAAYDSLAPLLAANLDGFVFRKELVKLTGALQQANARLAQAQDWSAKLERDGTAWAAKLEVDIAELKRDQARLGDEVGRLAEENRRLADVKAAFDLLPEFLRRYLTKRAFRARSRASARPARAARRRRPVRRAA